jgi:hypothetical protein
VKVRPPASTGTVSVTAGAGCAWTAASAAAWITVTGGAAGTGNGTVSLSIAANPASGLRAGTVTIAGQTVTVTQQGVPCTTSISPASVSAPAGSTNGTVNVAAPAGCAWTAASNAAWLTINSGAAGSGAGAVTYMVSANAASSVRSGSLTIGGQTFNVSQSGTTCTTTFNPGSVSIGTGGGAHTVDVATGTGCAWSATPSVPWVVITSGGSGTGPGTITYTVAANTGTSSRNGTIAVAGSPFLIAQAGTCAYFVSPLSVTAGAAAATANVFVNAAAGCSWTAVSQSQWLTITSGESGSGGGTVALSAAANDTASARVGTATIAGQTFTINQSACSYTLSPATVTLAATGTSTNAFVFTTPSCSWSATTNESWITMPNGSSGTGSAFLNYAVAANPDTTPRSGTITVAGRILTVNQSGPPCAFTVTPANIVVSKSGGTATVTVAAASGCSWTVQNSHTWVTITSGQSGSANGSVTLQVAPNPLPFPRAGAIFVAGKMVVINQNNVVVVPSAPSNLRIVP